MSGKGMVWMLLIQLSRYSSKGLMVGQKLG